MGENAVQIKFTMTKKCSSEQKEHHICKKHFIWNPSTRSWEYGNNLVFKYYWQLNNYLR